MNNQTENLLSCGYSKQDILDLVLLFETQIKLLIPNVDSLENEVIAAEMHKLKGGCELLSFTSEAKELTRLSEALLADEIRRRELMSVLRTLLTKLNSIRGIVSSS